MENKSVIDFVKEFSLGNIIAFEDIVEDLLHLDSSLPFRRLNYSSLSMLCYEESSQLTSWLSNISGVKDVLVFYSSSGQVVHTCLYNRDNDLCLDGYGVIPSETLLDHLKLVQAVVRSELKHMDDIAAHLSYGDMDIEIIKDEFAVFVDFCQRHQLGVKGDPEGVILALMALEIMKEARRLGLKTMGGECAEVAVAMNQVIFEGKGELAACVNTAFDAKGVFLGHVALRIHDKSSWVNIDGEGIKSDNELMSWGMLDHSDIDYAARAGSLGIEWTEEAADETDIYIYDDSAMLLNQMPGSGLDEKIKIINKAKACVYAKEHKVSL
jgi:hypothetical protein